MAAYNKEIAFTLGVNERPSSFTAADGVIFKQVFAPANPASRIIKIAIASTAATQKILLVRCHNLNTAEKAIEGFIVVPANAGTNGTVKVVSGLNRGDLPWLNVDSDGNPYWDLNFNMTVEIALYDALTGTETISVTVGAGSYAEEV